MTTEVEAQALKMAAKLLEGEMGHARLASEKADTEKELRLNVQRLLDNERQERANEKAESKEEIRLLTQQLSIANTAKQNLEKQLGGMQSSFQSINTALAAISNKVMAIANKEMKEPKEFISYIQGIANN